eukprot:400271-Pleurochrysis_carterae.AAC.4
MHARMQAPGLHRAAQIAPNNAAQASSDIEQSRHCGGSSDARQEQQGIGLQVRDEAEMRNV